MDAAQHEQQLGADFWRTGLVLALIVTATIVGEGAQYLASVDAVTNAAAKQVRANHPDAGWVFNEWDDCQHGRKRYADGQKPVYYTQDQCDAAVVSQAERRGLQQAVVNGALKNQSTAVAAAQSTVAPAWPLSMFF